MPTGKGKQINVYGQPPLKHLYDATKRCGYNPGRMVLAGFLWLCEHPEHRDEAMRRLSAVEELPISSTEDAIGLIRSAQTAVSPVDAYEQGRSVVRAGAARESRQGRRRSNRQAG